MLDAELQLRPSLGPRIRRVTESCAASAAATAFHHRAAAMLLAGIEKVGARYRRDPAWQFQRMLGKIPGGASTRRELAPKPNPNATTAPQTGLTMASRWVSRMEPGLSPRNFLQGGRRFWRKKSPAPII